MDGKPLTRELKANLAERKVDECGFAFALSRDSADLPLGCPARHGPQDHSYPNEAMVHGLTSVAISALLHCLHRALEL